MTRQEDVEMRHPSKIVIHTIDGFHKGHTDYLDLQRNLMYRLKIYGVEATYV